MSPAANNLAEILLSSEKISKETLKTVIGNEGLPPHQICQRLIDMGLSGVYNSTIAKLILSSNHGMRERLDKTSDDKPINNFNDEQVDRIADRISRRKSDDGGISSSKKSD